MATTGRASPYADGGYASRRYGRIALPVISSKVYNSLRSTFRLLVVHWNPAEALEFGSRMDLWLSKWTAALLPIVVGATDTIGRVASALSHSRHEIVSRSHAPVRVDFAGLDSGHAKGGHPWNDGKQQYFAFSYLYWAELHFCLPAVRHRIGSSRLSNRASIL